MAFALAEEGRAIRVWRRDGEATVVEVVPFTPFLLLADPALLGQAPGLLGVESLAGAGALRWRAREWMAATSPITSSTTSAVTAANPSRVIVVNAP